MPYPNSIVYGPEVPLDQQPAVLEQFARREPVVLEMYRAILAASQALGPVTISASKSGIQLMADTAFAGIHARKATLLVTLKAGAPIRSPRIRKTLAASRNRVYCDVLLELPDEVDAEFRAWLAEGYELSVK